MKTTLLNVIKPSQIGTNPEFLCQSTNSQISPTQRTFVGRYAYGTTLPVHSLGLKEKLTRFRFRFICVILPYATSSTYTSRRVISVKLRSQLGLFVSLDFLKSLSSLGQEMSFSHDRR